MTKETNALGQTGTYQYDKAGELTQYTDPNGQAIQYAYTNTGLVSAIHYNSMDFSFRYDHLGRKTEMVSPSATNQFSYDAVGNLLSLTNSEDRTTSYTYDQRNLMTSITDPDGNQSTFHYDALGRETTRSLANGNNIEKSYNTDGRLQEIVNKNSTGVISSFAYQYDAAGNRTKQIEEDGAQTNYTYDQLNRLIEVTYPIDKLKSMEQDQVTSSTTTQDNTQTTTTKGNNGKGNSNKKDNTTKLSYSMTNTSSMDMHVNNEKTSPILVLLANNNGKGKSTKGSSGSSGTTNNKGGNSSSKGKNKQSSDTTSSTTKAVKLINDTPDYLVDPQSKVSYTYDKVGNRLTMTDDQGTTDYQYNDANQLIQAGDTTYSYDQNGNLVSKIEGGQETKYIYNDANQLIEVQLADGTYVKYGYDAQGRKVYREEANIAQSSDSTKNNGQGQIHGQGKGLDNTKSNNGQGLLHGNGNKYGLYKNSGEGKLDIEKTAYEYQGLTNVVLQEYSDKGSPYAEYHMGPNNQVISRKMFGLHGLINPTQEPSLNTNGGLMYYQYDGLNTVSELTNKQGDVIEQYRYDAFGNIFTGITAPYNSTGYTGHSYDDKSGLVDMNARWYNSSIGRFMTQDTYQGTLQNPLSRNRYAYTMNNSIS